MRIVVIAEHDHETLRPGTRSALGFARSLVHATDGHVSCLLLGHNLNTIAQDAARLAPVIVADHPALEHAVADRWAEVIARVVNDERADIVVAASNTFAKDVIGRAAGLLGGNMASDVVGHELRDDQLFLKRPMHAGAVVATITLAGQPKIITIRSTAYEPASAEGTPHDIKQLSVNPDELPMLMEFEGLQSKQTGRPDVSEARVVVSGGRALKNSDDFEHLVGGLADALNGATGSSRALVDAGITANEFQVGQTGKVVAPELYIAVGISGAVQHLAGMKNSKVIVAINNDPEAPILEVADYALVGDAYELVPELIEKLNAS